MSIIYGIDTEKPYTAVDIRDAIIKCFKQAHDAVLEKDLGDFRNGMNQGEFDKIKEINVHQLVRKYFEEAGGSFNEPTKESLIAVCNKLAEFAKNFRDQETIKKHYGEIMQLLEKLP